MFCPNSSLDAWEADCLEPPVLATAEGDGCHTAPLNQLPTLVREDCPAHFQKWLDLSA